MVVEKVRRRLNKRGFSYGGFWNKRWTRSDGISSKITTENCGITGRGHMEGKVRTEGSNRTGLGD